ncbi:MAG: hypothetical protein JWO82_3979, partial [Akkermansiaceae bacterium]|nr:hypothetical protein [Akkermansiaceae bacterium]
MRESRSPPELEITLMRNHNQPRISCNEPLI